VADTTESTTTAPTPDPATDAGAATVEALSRALELHDYRRGEFGETIAHTTRVTRLALVLAKAAAPELILDPQLEHGFRLHDIGMIGVSSSTLLKSGPLSEAELDEIREHPWLGERIVAPVPSLNGLAREVIACHHERWDGSGYPRGLHGTDIPLAARVFAIVDSFDAMTHDQPYRGALTLEEACEEISAGAGKNFDPEIVRLFLSLGALEELRNALAAEPEHALDAELAGTAEPGHAPDAELAGTTEPADDA
jgi:HD-GYP domain-containing protein (c-di-GMP phosphodiesterase class II)